MNPCIYLRSQLICDYDHFVHSVVSALRLVGRGRALAVCVCDPTVKPNSNVHAYVRARVRSFNPAHRARSTGGFHYSHRGANNVQHTAHASMRTD